MQPYTHQGARPQRYRGTHPAARVPASPPRPRPGCPTHALAHGTTGLPRRRGSRRISLVLALAFTWAALPAGSAAAWTGAGHRLIALLAYFQLPAETRRQVVTALQSHERYRTDFLDSEYFPAKASPAEQESWLFAQAATWPDLVRDLDEPLKQKFHRPRWHYINHPVFLTPSDREALAERVEVQLEYRWDPDQQAETLNIVQALHKNASQLRDPYCSPREKAVAWCWMLHLVGDVHQPLHTTKLFDRRVFRHVFFGDLGGNRILFDPEGKSNLHSRWDGLLNSPQASWNDVRSQAQRILADKRLVAEGQRSAQEMRYPQWVDESVTLSKQLGYAPELREQLEQAGLQGRRQGSRGLAITPPSAAYLEQAGRAARKRAVAAGFRLAKQIEILVQ